MMTGGNGYAALIARSLDADVMERMAAAVDAIAGGVVSENTVGFCCHTLGDFLDMQEPDKREEIIEGLVWLIRSVGERRRMEGMQ